MSDFTQTLAQAVANSRPQQAPSQRGPTVIPGPSGGTSHKSRQTSVKAGVELEPLMNFMGMLTPQQKKEAAYNLMKAIDEMSPEQHAKWARETPPEQMEKIAKIAEMWQIPLETITDPNQNSRRVPMKTAYGQLANKTDAQIISMGGEQGNRLLDAQIELEATPKDPTAVDYARIAESQANAELARKETELKILEYETTKELKEKELEILRQKGTLVYKEHEATMAGEKSKQDYYKMVTEGYLNEVDPGGENEQARRSLNLSLERFNLQWKNEFYGNDWAKTGSSSEFITSLSKGRGFINSVNKEVMATLGTSKYSGVPIHTWLGRLDPFYKDYLFARDNAKKAKTTGEMKYYMEKATEQLYDMLFTGKPNANPGGDLDLYSRYVSMCHELKRDRGGLKDALYSLIDPQSGFTQEHADELLNIHYGKTTKRNDNVSTESTPQKKSVSEAKGDDPFFPRQDKEEKKQRSLFSFDRDKDLESDIEERRKRQNEYLGEELGEWYGRDEEDERKKVKKRLGNIRGR